MTKSIECAGTTAARKDDGPAPVGRMFDKHTRALNAFVKRLEDMHYLQPHEVDILKRNEAVLLSSLYEHAERLKPSVDKDSGRLR